jgi:hypothetical protein
LNDVVEAGKRLLLDLWIHDLHHVTEIKHAFYA